MNKNILGLLLLMPQFLFSQNEVCTIKGKVSSTVSTNKVYLVDLMMEIIDSTIINKGEFEMQEKIVPGDIRLIKLIFDHSKEDKQPDITHAIFLSPGIIDIKIDLAPENRLIMQLRGPLLSMDYEEKLYKPAVAATDTIKHLVEKITEAKKLGLADTAMYKKMIAEKTKQSFAIIKKYIMENPSSILSIHALNMMGNGDPAIPATERRINELHSLFDLLSDSVKNSTSGRKYYRKLLKMI